MSKDPRKMKLTEKCYTCFNSNVAVKCSGDLVRYKPGSETEWWITINALKPEAIAARNPTRTYSIPTTSKIQIAMTAIPANCHLLVLVVVEH